MLLARLHRDRDCRGVGVSGITDDDLDAAARRRDRDKPRSKGTLPFLPERDAPLSHLREWLTRAFSPPTGYTLDEFERHGRRLSDPAYVQLRTPAGGSVRYRFPEQRALAKPTNLRSSVVSITDGLCRMGNLTAAECADVWTALVTVAHVAAEQDEVEEFREWLDSFLRVTEPEGRYTLSPTGRYDALTALQARGSFERRHANVIASEVDERKWSRRPVLLVDADTAQRWVRVNELSTYLRHVIGQPLGHGVLDGRMSEIGATRVQYEVRNGASHPKITFYRLAADGPEGVE